MQLMLHKVYADEKEILKNLITLFLHDLSEFNDTIDLNPINGLFEFDVFEWFFEKEGLTPLLILLDEQPIGFILLQSGSYTNPDRADYIINSFFIIKKHRRKGLGKAACQKLFDLYPGRYAVGQVATNLPAIQFWKSLYKAKGLDFVEKEEIEDGMKVVYQYFKIS